MGKNKAIDSSRWNLVFVSLVRIMVLCSYTVYVSFLVEPFVFSYRTNFYYASSSPTHIYPELTFYPGNGPASRKNECCSFYILQEVIKLLIR